MATVYVTAGFRFQAGAKKIHTSENELRNVKKYGAAGSGITLLPDLSVPNGLSMGCYLNCIEPEPKRTTIGLSPVHPHGRYEQLVRSSITQWITIIK